jgi:methionyl-tRNA synthetase
MSANRKKFYLTTPIYYVNARPHIGHAYTTIVADVLARRHRLLGDDTFFLTGTDEHGQKIERSAAVAGIAPQQFADQVSIQFRNLWDRMGLTYDRYIRTTDAKHKRGAQKLFADLYERGFIYLDSYTGQYSIGEEMFVEGPPGTIGPDGKPTETVTEENFFFKLSAFQLPLIDLIESDTLAITPEARKNEVLSFLRGDIRNLIEEYSRLYPDPETGVRESDQDVEPEIVPTEKLTTSVLTWAQAENKIKQSKAGFDYIPGVLKDLSVSRSSFTWGIPVPEPAASTASQKHIIYVWLDALANYMTAIGYGSDDPKDQVEFDRYWPANLHLVGKEIIRFHCAYWPAFLLALNPALQHNSDEKPPILTIEEHREWAADWLPKAITAHGWLLFDNSKMSKSKGNIVRTETILDAFGDEVYGKQFPDSTKAERDLFAADVLRYFLLREIPFGQDGSFSFDALVTRYNADLANGYGNLVSRTLSMIQKYFDGLIPEPNFLSDTPPQGVASLPLMAKRFDSPDIYGWDFSRILEHVWGSIGYVDGAITQFKPWVQAARGEEGKLPLALFLYTCAESIRHVTAFLYPFLPTATAKVWAQLGLGDIEVAARNGELNNLQWGGLKPGTKLGPLAPIFPRADKGLVQIMTDMENPTPTETRPEAPLKAAATPAHAQPVPADSTHPAAAPRTSSLGEPTGTLPVAGSGSTTTHNGPTPSHADAPASGPFTSVASQTPITAGPADAAPTITIDDFAKIELRVAQILVAERIPKADKLLRLEVDLGHEKRQILSGIAEWYTPEDLIGRRIVVITNLAPRKMRGLESHGMLLAASEGEGGKPVLATFGEEIALGSRLK